MATVIERLAKMETRQDEHEKANTLAIAGLSEKIVEVEAVAMEAREMVTQTNTLVAQMPTKIIEAIEAKNKGKRFEAKEWLTLAIGILLLILAIPSAAQAYQSLTKPQSSVQASK